MKILVTGGAGYIGSHTCVELLNSGYEVVVMDNLYNASAKALDRVQQITGKTLTFYEADMLDQPAMDKIFEAEKPDAVIHFAGCPVRKRTDPGSDAGYTGTETHSNADIRVEIADEHIWYAGTAGICAHHKNDPTAGSGQ